MNMARIKAAKVEPCASRAEFEAAVDTAAKCCVQREKLVAALKARHQQLDDKYGAEIKAIDADIKAAHERAAPYFEAHAGELCLPGRRSGSTKLANFGVRLGLPTVTKAGKFKKVAWKALGVIFDGVEKLKQFVRNQPEVDKEAILAVFRDLKSEDPEVVAAAMAKKKVLDEYEISMEQTDEFWIEPIADEQVK
jgi:phage host-nuclease inhibitor protein Gam